MNEKDISTSLKEKVEQAKKVGFDTVPESTNLLESQVLRIFDESQKILTAKQIQRILDVKSTKWFSDKLWNLAKNGKLTKCETRGFYKSVRKD